MNICVCVHVFVLCAKSLHCEPLRLLCPWLSPGKNTGLGFHALLQEDLLDPGIKTTFLKSPALAHRFFTTKAAWEVACTCTHTHTHTHTHVCVYIHIYF